MKNKIALGTVQFGLDYGISSQGCRVSQNKVDDILNYAHKHGIDFLDTAPSYGDSERVLGNANSQEFQVITKTRHFDRDTALDERVEQLTGDFHKSLQLLKRKSVYGVLVHNANDLLQSDSGGIIDQLQTMKQRGLISKIGVSIYTGDQLKKIIDTFDIDLVQLPFSIFDRRLLDSDLLHKVYEQGIEVHARSIFLQGLLLMSERDRPEKFNRWKGLWRIWHEWLNDNKLTALEATIRYAVSMPEISKVLVGVQSKGQLQDILTAVDGALPPLPKALSIHDPELLNPSNWKSL